jgi:hypothetical protein
MDTEKPDKPKPPERPAAWGRKDDLMDIPGMIEKAMSRPILTVWDDRTAVVYHDGGKTWGRDEDVTNPVVPDNGPDITA